MNKRELAAVLAERLEIDKKQSLAFIDELLTAHDIDISDQPRMAASTARPPACSRTCPSAYAR